jgi:hypothetical protein
LFGTWLGVVDLGISEFRRLLGGSFLVSTVTKKVNQVFMVRQRTLADIRELAKHKKTRIFLGLDVLVDVFG